MKTIILMIAMGLAVVSAHATEYYFRVDTQTNMVASFTSPVPRNLNPTAGRVLIAVTQVQWGTGTQADFDVLPGAVIAAGIAAAQTQASDFAAWDERIKALAKVCRKQINLIRVAHGQPAYTVQEWKDLLKAEM